MPKTLDDKVVSIEFDNKKFEKNAKQTMSTIDKLKAKLRFNKENRMSDDINKEIENVDLSPMETALRKFDLKCSAFEIARITGIQRIVNAAITAGANITRQLTTVPVSTGFAEYEEKMGSVQTIMASTAESLETVMDALEKLNIYADKTIYSFSDMTSNIGKFTNAGVKLQDAVDAIRGVSNVAAVSGANANEASRAMYNLAQSLSAGYVKLIDWKSIENANMATVEFKKNLLETAAAQGSLKKVSKDVYKTLKGNTVTATRNFNETLQEQWLTSEALIKTLRDYADETTEIGKKAYAAAQDVKTLSMLFDTLKEAVQSGWGTTWELIIGDFEEAKSFLSEVSNVFGDFIGKVADARNYLLMGGLSKQSNNWKKITNAISKAGISTEEFNNSLIETGRLYVANLDEIIANSGSFDESLKRGWLNSDIITEVFKKFNDSLATTTKTYTEEQKAIIKNLYSSASESGGVVNNLISNMDEYVGASGRENVLAGIVNIFTAIAKLSRSVGAGINAAFGKINSKTVYEMTDRFQRFTKSLILSDETFDKIARTIRGVANAFKFVGKIIKTGLTFALQIVCNLLGIAGDSFLDLSANLGDWITKTITSLRQNEALKDVIVTILSYIKILSIYIGKLFSKIRSNKKVLSGINKLLRFLNSAVEDIGNYLAGGIKVFSKWISGLKELDGFTFDNLIKAFDSLSKDVLGYFFDFNSVFKKSGNVIESFKKKLSTIWSGFVEDFQVKYTVVYNIIKQIYDWISSFVTKKKNNLISILSNGINPTSIATVLSAIIGVGIAKGLNKIGAALGMVAAIAKNAGDTLGEVGLAIRRLSKGLTRYFDASSFVKIAISMAILTASLVALAFVPYDKLKAAVPVLAKLSAIFLGLNFAMMLMNKLGGSSSAPGGLIATLLAVILFVSNLATVTDKLTELSRNFDEWIKPIQEAETFGDMMKALGKQSIKIIAACVMMAGAVAMFGVFMKALSFAGTLSIKGGIALAIMMSTVYLFVKRFVPLLQDTIEICAKTFNGFIGLVKKGNDEIGVFGVIGVVSTMSFAFAGLIVAVIALGFAVKKLTIACVPLLKSISSLASMVMLIYVEALVIKWLSKKVGSLVPEITTVLIIFGSLAYIMGNYAKMVSGIKDLPKVGKSMLALSASMLILTSALGLLTVIAKNNTQGLLIAGTVMAVIMAALVAFVREAGGKDFQSIASSIFKIGIGIGLVVASIVVLSSFINEENAETIKYIAGLILGLGFVIGLVILAIKSFNKQTEQLDNTVKESVSKSNTKKFEGVWQSIVAFGSIVAEIAGILYLFTTKIDWSKDAGGFWQAVGGIVAIVLAVGTVFWAITKMGNSTKKDAKSSEQSITYTGKSMGMVIAAMSGLAYLVSMILPIADLPIGNVITAASAITAVSGMVALVILSMSSLSSDTEKVSASSVMAITLTLAGLAGLVYELTLLAKFDVDSLISAGAVVAGLGVVISIMVNSFGSSAKSASAMSNQFQTMCVGFLIIAASLSALALSMSVLASMDTNSIAAAGEAMIGMALVIGGVLVALGKLPSTNASSVITFAAAFAILAGSMLLIAASLAIVGSSSDFNSIIVNALAMSMLVIILAGVMSTISSIGGSTAVVGAAAFAIMTAGILIMSNALSKLADMDTGRIVAAALSITIMTTAMTGILTVLAGLASTGLGIAGLLVAVAAIYAIAGAIAIMANATMTAANAFDKFVSAAEKLPIILSVFFDELESIITKSAENAEKAYEAGTMLISNYIRGLTDGISNSRGTFDLALLEFLEDLYKTLTGESFYSTGYDNGFKLMLGMAEGITSGTSAVIAAISASFETIGQNIDNSINSMSNRIAGQSWKFQNSGVYLMQGLDTGLNNPAVAMLKWTFTFGRTMLESFNEALDIHSPSGEMKRSGQYIYDGLEKSVIENLPNVAALGTGYGYTFVEAFNAQTKKVGISSGSKESTSDGSKDSKKDTSSESSQTSNKTTSRMSYDEYMKRYGKYQAYNISREEYESGQKKATKSEDESGQKKATKSEDESTGILGEIENKVEEVKKALTSGDLFASLGLDNLLGSSNVSKLTTEEQQRINSIGDKLNSAVSSASTDIQDKYAKYFSDWKAAYGAYNDLASKPMDAAKPVEMNQRLKLLDKYQKLMDENVSWAYQYIGNVGLSKEDIDFFWSKTGSPGQYNSSSVLGTSLDSLVDQLGGNSINWSDYFSSGDNDSNGNDIKNNTDSILDALNKQNNILGSGTSSEKSYTFVQNNYSPKALSSVEIYRQTNNQLSRLARKGW